ncbi:MAG: hypothetical protein ABSE68_03250, partial [Minisyncoccia bacterium]
MKSVRIIFWIVVAGVIILAAALVSQSPTPSRAAGTNINSLASSSVAWDDAIGWWDFYNTLNVTVHGTRIEGYASSSAGDISLDCATTRNGHICGTVNYGVCNGPGPHNVDG